MKAKDLFPFWGDVQEDLLRCLELAAPAQLGFRPTPPQMTLGGQFRHVVTVEEYWQNVLERCEPLHRDYEEADLPGKAEIRAKLGQLNARTNRILDAWEAERVRSLVFPTRGGSVTAHWILNHCYEHAIHHKGQLMVYFRLLGRDPAERF